MSEAPLSKQYDFDLIYTRALLSPSTVDAMRAVLCDKTACGLNIHREGDAAALLELQALRDVAGINMLRAGERNDGWYELNALASAYVIWSEWRSKGT